MSIKPMADKAKEAVHLLTQIKDLGISDIDVSYLEIKQYLNDWIRSEEQKVFEYEIFFVRYGRNATLTLPWKSERSAEFRMKALKKTKTRA